MPYVTTSLLLFDGHVMADFLAYLSLFPAGTV